MKTTTPSALPPSAPRAKAKSQSPNPRGPFSWEAMKESIARIWAVAWCEMLLLTRSMVFWVMLAVFVLLTVLNARTQVTTSVNYLSDGQASVALCGYAASFIFFLLPFLYVNIFARDRQRQAHQLVWTRPLVSLEYVLGKGLGAVSVSLLLSWLPLLAGWIALGFVRGGIQPLDIWLPLLLVVGAGSMLVTSCALLAIALTSPLGLLGALIIAGLIVYIDIIFAKSLLFLRDLTFITLFTSPSIGFGPDGKLLLWQRLSYLAGGFLCLSLAALVYQLRERLGIVQRRHLVSTVLLIVLTVGALLGSSATFQSIGESYTDTGGMHTMPLDATTSHFSIDVAANPSSGVVQGTTTFTLTPRSQREINLVIELNPGLHLQHVTALPISGGIQELAWHPISPGWTSIDLANTSFANNQAVSLRIVYGGQMLYGRDDYAAAAGGYGNANGTAWSQDFFYLSFLGNGAGEFMGAAGSWYPLPLTQQALESGTRIPVDTLQLRLPSSFSVWSGLAGVAFSSRGNWQELDAQPHAGLPVALAVALQHVQRGSVAGLPFWYQGHAPDQVQLLTFRLLMQELHAMNNWLASGSATATFQTVIVPVLPFPVVGDGLLLIPEMLTGAGIDPFGGSPYTAVPIARIEGAQLATSWWLNAAYFPFTLLSDIPDTQNAHDLTSIAPTNALLNMLSEYSAIVITDKAIGNNFFAREMQICSQLYALPADEQASSASQALQNQMTAMGTNCYFSTLVLYHLQLMPKIGFAGLTAFLKNYVQSHAEQKTDMREFLHQASVLAGKDITPEAGPYICPADGKNPPGTASDPLPCLNELYSGT